MYIVFGNGWERFIFAMQNNNAKTKDDLNNNFIFDKKFENST
jgi:hypothetical protein